MTGTWESCVREVTLSADPETVGALSGRWNNLSSSLSNLRDALVGRSFVGPIASGTERPHTDGLPGLLVGWKGSGGDAYREHLSDIGRGIEDLITNASNVSGALSRIEGDVRKALASIPIPLGDDFGINEWSLPNGGELDGAKDGESASAFLTALRKDYQSDPSSYADGAFREKADGLEATMKVDGQANDNKRGGFWDTSSHLNNWYRDNQQAANDGAAPLNKAIEVERPRLVVPGANDVTGHDEYRPRTPPAGYTPSGSDGGSTAGSAGFGGGPGLDGSGRGSTGISGSAAYGDGQSAAAVPTTVGSSSDHTDVLAGSYVTPPSRDDGPGSELDLGTTGLAGASGPTTVGGGYGGSASSWLGSQSPLGVGGGLGSPSGAGGGGFGAGGGGIGTGGLPGMVGGGNGRVPPVTSAAKAVRNATGAGRDGVGAGGSRGSAGGLLGGTGAAGRDGGAEHDESGPGSSWLTEDDDPWRADDTGSPGILR